MLKSKCKRFVNQYDEGLITDGERYNKVVDIWAQCADKVAKEMMSQLEKQTFRVDGKTIESASFNPIFIMADSGARGVPRLRFVSWPVCGV